MTIRKPSSLAVVLTVLLASCTPMTPQEGVQESSSPPFSDSSVSVSEEIAYRGVLLALEGAMPEEGTHRLSLGEGQYLLLQSDAVTLDMYLNEEVRVMGTVRETLRGDADIMRITRVEAVIADLSSLSSSSEDSSSSLGESSSSSVVSQVPSSSSASSASSAIPSSSSSSSVASMASSAAASSQASEESSDASIPTASAEATAMASANMDAAQWTQKYCTSHIGFCISVHKNWWYKSFGTTASHLWHVEVSSQEIDSLGQGPLQVNFESGPLPGGVTNGSVVASGDLTIGYRAWTGDRHFQIVAPKVLREAVAYMTASLVTYDTPAN